MLRRARSVSRYDWETPRRSASGRTIALSALEQFVRVSLAFAIGTRVARALGSGGYGDLAVGLGLAALLLPIATMGTDSLLLARIASSPIDDARWSAPAFRLRVAGSALALACSIPIALAVSGERSARLTIVFACAAVAAAPLDVGYIRAVATHRLERVAPVRIGLLLIGASSKLVAISSGGGPPTIALIFLLESLVVAATTTVMTRGPRITSNVLDARSVLLQSSPFLLSGLLFAVYLRVDVVMVRALLGANDLGIYAVATRISELGTTAASLVVPALAAAIAHTRTTDGAGARAAYRSLYRRGFAFGASVAIVLSVAGWFTVVPLFGNEFSSSRGVLVVHAASIPAVWITAVAGREMGAQGSGRGLVGASLIGASINVVLNFAFLPTIGVAGAAFATTVSYWMTAGWLLARSGRSPRTTDENARVTLSAATKTLRR